jgi:hypothetical protein
MVFAGMMALLANAQVSSGTSVRDGWVTVAPAEFQGAINNPLKGFRAYKKAGYGLLERKYIKWSDIEACEGDSVERIIALTRKITETKGRRFEELNVKLVPRVYPTGMGPLVSSTGPRTCTPTTTTARSFRSG